MEEDFDYILYDECKEFLRNLDDTNYCDIVEYGAEANGLEEAKAFLDVYGPGYSDCIDEELRRELEKKEENDEFLY